MNRNIQDSGYREIEVTADRGIEVWAPDLEELFRVAAIGMLDIAGLKTEIEKEAHRDLKISAIDHETLLISFLEEILFLLEDEATVFSSSQISINEFELHATMSGKKAIWIENEIKAVTYNNLEIKFIDNEYQVTIVFDL